MIYVADVIAAHERLLTGRPGGCRAIFRFEKIPGLALQQKKLDEIEFVGCDLTSARLTLSSFRSASFYCSSLRDADLRGADLTRADLRGATIRGADLYRAVLDGADFRKAVLVKDDRDNSFESCDWVDEDAPVRTDGSVDFRDCSMKGARLNGAKLKGANFEGALLEEARLTGADLRDANLDGAVLTGVDLEGARLEGCSMTNVLRDPAADAKERAPKLKAQIVESDRYTRSNGGEGARAEMDGEDLRVIGQGFARKGLVGASFKNACGVGVDFSGAALVGAVFNGADLRGARFNGANLRACSFRDCNLSHAVFDDADIRSFEGKAGRVFRPSFDGATLRSVRFAGTTFDPGCSLPAELEQASEPIALAS